MSEHYTCPNCGMSFDLKFYSQNIHITHLNSCPVLLKRKRDARKNKAILPIKLEPTTVDVIIPCHNYGKYLDQCLESVKSTLPLTIVVIDDSSTEDIKSIVAKYPNVTYVRVDYGSPNETRKHGYNLTSSDYVMFLDADDYLGENYIDLSVEALQQDNAHIAHTAIQEFRESSITGQYNKGVFWEPPKEKEINFCHVGCLVKRSLIEEKKPFEFPNEYPCEDFEFWRRVSIDYETNKLDPNVIFTNCKAVYNYRKHEISRFNNVPRSHHLSNVVISTYFTGMKDPQHNRYVKQDDIGKVSQWIETALKHKLKPVILTDHETPKIAYKWPEVKCVPITVPTEYGWYYRWKAIEKYLTQLIKENRTIPKRNIQTVLITDLFDVTFNNNPYKCFTKDYDLYVGSEPMTIGQNNWVLHYWDKHYQNECPYLNEIVYNAGIIGGKITYVKAVATAICEDLEDTGLHNQDMIAFNRILHEAKTEGVTIFTGAPFHSEFKSYQYNRNDLCIVHK